MSSTMFVYALLLMDIPSSNGFVSNSHRTPSSRQYICSARRTTNRYARDWTWHSSLSTLNANTGPGDNRDEEKDDNNNMKSDDELIRDTINNDKQYTAGSITDDTNANEDDEEDLYMKKAPSEFIESEKSLKSALARASPVDWGDALETLSQRKSDILHRGRVTIHHMLSLELLQRRDPTKRLVGLSVRLILKLSHPCPVLSHRYLEV